MVDLRSRFAGLSKPMTIEVIYLAGRFLTHRLTWEGFQRQLRSDVRTANRDRSVPILAQLMNDIEKAEGVPIEEIPMEKRAAYVAELDDFLLHQTPWPADDDEIERSLVELREEHW